MTKSTFTILLFVSCSIYSIVSFGIRNDVSRRNCRVFATKADLVAARPLDLIFEDEDIKLVTPILKFEKRVSRPNVPKKKICVDLYGMVHIADATYYAQIQDRMKNYDVVLFELITSNQNTRISGFKRTLSVEVRTTESALLAKKFSLSCQLDSLYLQGPTWYIADIDSDTLRKLEYPRRGRIIFRYWLSLLTGRNGNSQLMRNFFLSDTSIVNTLRLLSWLGPCPEITCLLLDWSRMNPNAGGLPMVLEPMVEKILKGQIGEAQKLAFAQQLVSGVPDSGEWGGEAMSDVKMRVSARNSECCRILEAFANEFLTDGPCEATQTSGLDDTDTTAPTANAIEIDKNSSRRIAVLYGAFHLKDLTSRLSRMGFELMQQNKPVELLPAWTMTREEEKGRTVITSAAAKDAKPAADTTTESQLTANPSSLSSSLSSSSSSSSSSSASRKLSLLTMSISSRTALILGGMAYLAAGALDWYLVLAVTANVLESQPKEVLSSTAESVATISAAWPKGLPVLNSYSYASGQSDLALVPSLFTEAALRSSVVKAASLSQLGAFIDDLLSGSGGTAVFLSLYLVAYIQRHLAALRAISSVGIQWDRGLFDDDIKTRK